MTKKRLFDFWRDLNTNERLTALLALSSLFVALGSLAVAYMTWRTASDTADIKRAVAGLAALAKASGEEAKQASIQATALNDQLGQIRREADATANLVEPARSSAAAAITGVKQQAQQFVLDQRPAFAFVPPAPGDSDGIVVDKSKTIGWSYTIQDIGKTAAFNAVTDQEMSILGLPFVRFIRGSGAELDPGEKVFSTAVYPFRIPPALAVPGTPIPVILRVRIYFEDAGHRVYRRELCLANQGSDSPTHYCDFSKLDNIGLDPRSPPLPKSFTDIVRRYQHHQPTSGR